MAASREKQLLKNTGILALGKICTQFVSFFLLPLYTAYLSSKEYGVVDLLNNYVSLLIPIFFFQMDQALFRFLIDARKNEKSKSEIISTALLTVTIQAILFVIIYLAFCLFVNNEYKYFLLLNVIVAMYSSMLLQICRGLGDNVSYSLGSLVSGISTIVINVIFITVLHWGAYGMLTATLIANILCIIFLFFKKKIYKIFKFKNYDKKQRKELWKYSIPLIPNQLSWWIVNVSDRTIIVKFIDMAANGVYSAANKFSAICITLFNFFNMTWSESASMHIKDGDSDEFFSKIFNTSLKLFSSVCFIIIAIMPFTFKYLITGKGYTSAYEQIPILMIATIFNIIVSLIGSIYVALKKSNEIAKTSIFAAIINIGINVILIKKIGLYAASISTLVAYLSMSIYRYIDVQRHVKIKLDLKYMLFMILEGSIIVFAYYSYNKIFFISGLAVSIICSFVFNIGVIKSVLSIFRRKKKSNDKNIVYDRIIQTNTNEPTYINFYDSYNFDNINNYLDDLDRVEMKIRFDNSVIGQIDFSKCPYEISDVILKETKVYNFEFNNDYLLRHDKYPKQISNNYELMKYIIDQDYNYLAYIDPEVTDKDILIDIINYAFTKVYYMKVKNNEVDFDINNMFKKSSIIKHSYFKECYSYIDKMNKKDEKSKKKA